MRTFSLIVFIAALSIIADVAFASEGVDAVLKLQKNGTSESVLMTYVQTGNVAYDPTGDEIQTLEDANVPARVIVAMLDRGPTANATSTTARHTTPLSEADAKHRLLEEKTTRKNTRPQSKAIH